MPLVDVPSEVISETERRARTLEAAALEIEVRGWHQGGMIEEGRVCAAGAVACATGADLDNGESRLGSYIALAKAWYGDSFDDWAEARVRVDEIIEFNDRPGRTAEDVTFLLRNRADEIRRSF